MEQLFTEITHWLHQRGDTISATRLLSTRRWNSLRLQKFEQPLVFYVANLNCFMCHADAIDAGIWVKHASIDDKIPAGRVRVYKHKNLTIKFGAVRFPTIGDATNLQNLFNRNIGINIPLVWNTVNVQYTNCMFNHAVSFNQPLHWNTINLLDARNMFSNTVHFNQPLKWDTSRLKMACFMFYFADAFNQLLDWNTNNLECLCHMFEGAKSFIQCLSWNLIIPEDRDIFHGSSGSFVQQL